MADPDDLEVLRNRLGIKGTGTDALLGQAIDAAVAWAGTRIYLEPPDYWRLHADTYEAVMIKASRLYARLRSPEGISGWGESGVINVATSDPDCERLLERHLDMLRAGVA